MSPSTWAFTARSHPPGTTKPLFKQGAGPGPDTDVAAQGLLWDEHGPWWPDQAHWTGNLSRKEAEKKKKFYTWLSEAA